MSIVPFKDIEKRREWDKNYKRLYMREYMKNYGKKRRRLAKEEIYRLLGSKCAHCGFADPRAFQIDHVNGGGTKEKRKYQRAYTYYMHILNEIKSGSKDYQLLCANCNLIKVIENNENKRPDA